MMPPLRRFQAWLEPLHTAITLGNVRMERKLIIVFLFLIVLPMSLLSYWSYNEYSHSMESKTKAYVTAVSEQILNRLDNYISDMEQLSGLPAYVKDIRDNLREANRYYGNIGIAAPEPSRYLTTQGMQLAIQQKLEESILFLNHIKRSTVSVYVFDLFGNGYFNLKSSAGVRKDIWERYGEWKRLAEADPSRPVLISTQEVSGVIQSKRYVFTVVRQILDADSFEPLGLVAVDADFSFIEDIVKEMDNETKGSSLIVDSGDHVIYDSERQYLGVQVSDDPRVRQSNGGKGSFNLVDADKKFLCFYSQSEHTGWKLIVSVPEQELRKDARRTRDMTLISSMIITGFALTISVLLSFALTRPLRKMVRLMRQVQEGNLQVSFHVKYNDEIGRMGVQFNRMISRINELIAEVKLTNQRKRSAELAALQNQINPHFMYNTLEAIRMTAEMNGVDRVADMTFILSKMLRYSISSGSMEIVPLRQELEHLSHYMALLDFRYPGKFRMELEPLGEWEHAQVIKLLLQPIVENSVYHGMDGTNAVLTISIRHETVDDLLILSVSDDGIGMEAEKLRQLNESLRDANRPEVPVTNRRGIGLKNVNERLKLQYGDSFGLIIDSKPGKGTVVKIPLPLKRVKGGTME